MVIYCEYKPPAAQISKLQRVRNYISLNIHYIEVSWRSSVSRVTRLRAERRVGLLPAGAQIVFFSAPRPDLL